MNLEVNFRVDRFVMQHIERIIDARSAAKSQMVHNKTRDKLECKTINFDEISFNVNAHNMCSTPSHDENKTSILSTQSIDYKVVQSSFNQNTPAQNDWNISSDWRGLSNEAKLEGQKDKLKIKKRGKPTCLDNCPDFPGFHKKCKNCPCTDFFKRKHRKICSFKISKFECYFNMCIRFNFPGRFKWALGQSNLL